MRVPTNIFGKDLSDAKNFFVAGAHDRTGNFMTITNEGMVQLEDYLRRQPDKGNLDGNTNRQILEKLAGR